MKTRFKLVPLAFLAVLSGCGPSSTKVRLATLGIYFGIILLCFLISMVERLVRRLPFRFLGSLSNGFLIAGFFSLIASPFYGYAIGSFGAGFMLFVLAMAGLLLSELFKP